MKLEQFCETYTCATLIDFANRNRKAVDEFKDYFERCIKNVNLAKVDSLKLLLSLAMIYGNPFFNSIPKIIQGARMELQPELLKHLKRSSLVNFGVDVAKWLEKKYKLINEDTWHLCRGFELGVINHQYQIPALDIHLLVEVKDVK